LKKSSDLINHLDNSAAEYMYGNFDLNSNYFAMYSLKKQFDSALFYAEKNWKLAQIDQIHKLHAFNELLDAVIDIKDTARAIYLNNLHMTTNEGFKEQHPLRDRLSLFEKSYTIAKMSGDLQNAYFNLQVAYDLMQQYHKEKINLEMQKVDVGRKRVMQENKILAK